MVWMLREEKPAAAFGSMGIQLFLVTVLCRPVGGMLGFRLGEFDRDLFEYIQYFLFAWGFALAGGALGWLLLRIRKK